MDNHMFYGIPQSIWDNLCEEAEEILYNEELGTHLVGVYPAGNRIFGIESQSPGLMCLYVDHVEPMIDPLSSYHQEDGFKCFSIGHSFSPIVMVDLFKWIKWLFSPQGTQLWRKYSFLDVIPFGKHVIHEEPSISEIMKLCWRGLKETNFNSKYYIYEEPPIGFNKNRYLYNRTTMLLKQRKEFVPNINKEWDYVASFGKEFNQIDTAARKQLLNTTTMQETINCIKFLTATGNIYHWSETKELTKQTKDKITKAVTDFYRFQL